MAKKDYRLKYVIDSANAEASSRRVNRLLADGDKMATRLVASLAKAYDGAARIAEQSATRMSAAHGRVQASGTRSADAQARAAERSTQRAEAAAKRKTEAEARAYDKIQERATRAADREADRNARAQQREEERAQRKVEREARAYDKIQERATRVADRQADRDARTQQREENLAKRKAEREARASDRQRERDEKAAERDAERARKKAEAEARAYDRIQDRATRAADRAADAAVRAKERQAAKEAALTKKLLTDEELKRMVLNEKIKRINDARVDAARRAAGLESKGVEKLVESFGGLSTAAFALKAIADASDFMYQNFVNLNRQIIEATKFTTGYREALLELAALKGHFGDTGKEMKENLAFRLETLQTAEEAREFDVRYQSVISGATNMAPKEKEKFEKFAGAFQAAEHGNADAHARLAAMLPMLSGEKEATAESMSAKLVQAHQIFRPASFKFAEGANMMTELTPFITSGMLKDTEGMALLAGMSNVGNPNSAATNVEHFVRATVGGLGRMRGAQIEGGEKQGKYLKRLGATNQMSPLEIGKLMAKDLEEQEKKATGEGKKFSSFDYLRHHGFGNMEDVQAVLAYQSLLKSGTWQGKYEPLINQTPTAKEAQDQVAAAQATDPVFAQRRAELSDEMRKIGKGAGAPEYYEALRKTSWNLAAVRGNTGVAGEYDPERFNEWTLDPYRNMARMNTEGTMVEAHKRERARLGLPPLRLGYGGGDQARAREYNQSRQEILAAGGQDPMIAMLAEIKAAVNRQTEAQNKTREAFEKGQKKAPVALAQPAH